MRRGRFRANCQSARAGVLSREMSEYRVQLDVFSGPLDLLLYLIRRDEIDVQDISIKRLTDQYVEYVHLLRDLDPNAVGDFLVMASTLIELKSRALLPTPPLEALDDADDPRAALVKQLLEYKRFKDAARRLGSAADERAKRFIRQPAELPKELAGIELEEVEIWDLLGAFGKVMSAIGHGPGFRQIIIDETPIESYITTLTETLEFAGPTKFQDLFANRNNRAEIIGLFLAMLELIRRQRVRAEQDRAFGEIYLFAIVPADAEHEAALNEEESAALRGGAVSDAAQLSVAGADRLRMSDVDQENAASPEDIADAGVRAYDEAAQAAARNGGPAYFVAESEDQTLVVRLDTLDPDKLGTYGRAIGDSDGCRLSDDECELDDDDAGAIADTDSDDEMRDVDDEHDDPATDEDPRR